MHPPAATADRAAVAASFVVFAALGALCVSVLSGAPTMKVAPVIVLAIVFATAYRTLLAWHTLLALLVATILFVPMQRYVLPGALPFELEPYRLLVALILTGWIASLLVDPRVRVRRSGFEGPLLLLLVATIASVLANGGRVAALEGDVAKSLTFFVSFLAILYLIVSVVRTRSEIDFVLKVLVGSGAVVAFFAIVESRTSFNVFNHLSRAIPLLEPGHLTTAPTEDRGLRAYASAQHPIALGAVLVVLIPPAIYLVRRFGERRWWLAVLMLSLGALATLSRTSVIMLLVVGLVFLWLRPRETKRLLPLLLPGLIAVHFVLPGTIGTLKQAFFPEGGLLAEQSANAGYRGQGRVADIGPALDEFAEKPLFGQGYATRVVEHGRQNAQILDNQWLGTMLETGLLGLLAWVWLFGRVVRRLSRRAKEDPTSDGWLVTAVAASALTYAVGMLTFDAFAFVQGVLVLFVLLALGAAALAREPDDAPTPVPFRPARAAAA